MFSSLSSGVPLPVWDREMFLALQDAVLGLPRGEPTRVVSLLNSSGQVYRAVVVDGPAEHEAVTACLTGLGFEILAQGDESLARLRELVAALKSCSA